MVAGHPFKRACAYAAVFGLGLALMGCEGGRQATGVAKLPPDEFTVLTKAPLILPPDYNLRPPQPGLASRNDPDAEEAGRAALFPLNTTAAAAALGASYSDGEKLLLTKTNALNIDPNIRRSLSGDLGQEDQGPAFAQQVLYGAGQAPAQPAGAAPAAAPRPAQNAPLLEGTGAPPPARP